MREGKAQAALPMRSVLSFATITAAGLVLGQASGLLREVVVSAQFGLSAEIDAYKLAFLVPTLINNIIAGSAITVAVMPTLARYLTAGERNEFWHVTSVITNIVLIVTGAITILGMFLAGPIISVIGMGMPSSTQSLAAALLVIMMPTLLLGALLNMLMAALNSVDRFVGPALIFLALNGGIIGTVILLAPIIGIYSVALGFLIGVLFQVLVQSFELKREQGRYFARIDLHHPALRQVGIAFLPVTALAIVSQINLLIDGAMAAALPAGSLGALTYANTILGAFYSVGISLGIAVFPSLSRMATTNDLASAGRTIMVSLRVLVFILAPLTLLLMVFAVPVVGVLLGRGRFDANAVQMTAQALSMYAVGLISIAALYILQRAFYAISDGVTPLVIGSAVVILHVLLNLFLIPSMAHGGIALSASITTSLGVAILIVFLARRIPGVRVLNLAGFIGRCAALAVVSAAPVVWIFESMGLDASTWFARGAGVALAAAGGVIYFLLALATRIPESRMLLQTAFRFLGRGRQ